MFGVILIVYPAQIKDPPNLRDIRYLFCISAYLVLLGDSIRTISDVHVASSALSVLDARSTSYGRKRVHSHQGASSAEKIHLHQEIEDTLLSHYITLPFYHAYPPASL